MEFQKLIPHYPLARTKGANIEFMEMIYEVFTDHLMELGFNPYAAISAGPGLNDTDSGFHIMKFRHDGITEYRADWLKTITDQSVDGWSSQGLLHYDTLIITLCYDI